MPQVPARPIGNNVSLATRAVSGVYLATIVVVPTLMSREALNQEILKATVLVSLVLALVALRLFRTLTTGFYWRGNRHVAWIAGAFATALLVTSIFSSQPWVAFTGAPIRGIGAVTYLACLTLMCGIQNDYRKRSVEPLLSAFLMSHLIVAGYALVQAYGADPFNWVDKMAFSVPISSTLLNPNFSAAFIAITLPLILRHQFNRSVGVATRVACGAASPASMAAISFMDSFQAQLAALVALVVPLIWVMQHSGRRRLEASVMVAPVVATVSLFPFLLADSRPTILPSGDMDPVRFTGYGTLIVMTAMIGLCGWTLLCTRYQDGWTEESKIVEADRGSRPLRSVTIFGAVVALIGATVAVWPRISEQLASGLAHRQEMWQVGLDILQKNLIVGTGLETYFFHFSRLRPVEHAVLYEGLLSDNVHSVPISMLSGGGLLLGSAYFAILVIVGIYGVRALRQSCGSEQVMIGGVLAGWIAYQLQSTVSIDVVGLAFTQWILAGILLARGATGDLNKVPLSWIRAGSVGRLATTGRLSHQRRKGQSPIRQWLLMGTIAVALVVILGPISRPLRADLSYRDAQEDYIVGDIRASYDHMQSVVSLDSRNGQYRETLGKIFLEARDIPSALYEFEAGAQLRPGYALAERLAARINSDTGDIDRAVYWYEKALDSEPYGPFGLNQAAEFLATIGETDRMNERLAEYEKLNLEILNPVIADTYEALGDHDNAARVRGNRD